MYLHWITKSHKSGFHSNNLFEFYFLFINFWLYYCGGGGCGSGERVFFFACKSKPFKHLLPWYIQIMRFDTQITRSFYLFPVWRQCYAWGFCCSHCWLLLCYLYSCGSSKIYKPKNFQSNHKLYGNDKGKLTQICKQSSFLCVVRM